MARRKAKTQAEISKEVTERNAKEVSAIMPQAYDPFLRGSYRVLKASCIFTGAGEEFESLGEINADDICSSDGLYTTAPDGVRWVYANHDGVSGYIRGSVLCHV